LTAVYVCKLKAVQCSKKQEQQPKQNICDKRNS